MHYNNAFQVNAGNPRATLKVVNELHARKSTNSNVNEIEMNGHSIADVQELAKTFNYHFASVEPKKASIIPNGDSSHLEYLNLTLDDENCFVLKQTDVATAYSLLSESYMLLLLSKLSQSKSDLCETAS